MFNDWVTSVANYFKSTNIFLSVVVALVIVTGFVLFVVLTSRKKWKVGIIAEIGIACALSLVLGYFPIFRLPEGGSISLAMVPVVIVAMRNGLAAGIVTGVLAGVLQYFPDPFFVSPWQFLLDYPFAWGFFGLAGLVAKSGENGSSNSNLPKIIVSVLIVGVMGLGFYGLFFQGARWDLFVAIGIMLLFLVPGLALQTKGMPGFISALSLGVFGRFMMHFLSGNIYFLQYAWPGYTPIGYVSIYIASHLFFEALLCVVAVVALNKFIVKQEV